MGKKTRALPGASIETAIVIVASDSWEGIDMENAHIDRIFGRRWIKRFQSLRRENGRHYDAITIEIGRRTEMIFFDINSFLPASPKTGE